MSEGGQTADAVAAVYLYRREVHPATRQYATMGRDRLARDLQSNALAIQARRDSLGRYGGALLVVRRGDTGTVACTDYTHLLVYAAAALWCVEVFGCLHTVRPPAS